MTDTQSVAVSASTDAAVSQTASLLRLPTNSLAFKRPAIKRIAPLAPLVAPPAAAVSLQTAAATNTVPVASNGTNHGSVTTTSKPVPKQLVRRLVPRAAIVPQNVTAPASQPTTTLAVPAPPTPLPPNSTSVQQQSVSKTTIVSLPTKKRELRRISKAVDTVLPKNGIAVAAVEETALQLPSFVAPTSNDITREASDVVLGPRNAPFLPHTYGEPQKFIIDSAMRSAGLDVSEREAANLRIAFARAQTRKVGIGPAAYANNMIRQVESARAHAVGDATLLDAAPYVDPSGAFATSFLTSMIECAPESLAAEALPSDELRSVSEAVTFDYLSSFMTSARPNDFACARGRACFGMRLFDEHNRALPATVWKVFFKPSELPDVLDNPSRFESEAKTRYCIGCKLELAVDRVFTITAHNARMRPNLLACDIHVFVDIHDEFPVAATIGLNSSGYHGLVQNIPRISRVGWRVEPDSQSTGCYIYAWNIPRFPVPLAYYSRDSESKGGSAMPGAPSF